jgi:hypothetical protein
LGWTGGGTGFRELTAEPGAAAVPDLAEVFESGEAFGFELEAGQVLRVGQEAPFLFAAMLEEEGAVEVVLVHAPREGLGWVRDEGVGGIEGAKGELECVFVAVEIAVIEIGVFVEPEGEAEGGPAAVFIDEQLTAFESGFRGWWDAAAAPGGQGTGITAAVGPEEGAGLVVGLGIEEKSGVTGGDVVGVEEQDIAEWGVEDGVRFDFPEPEGAGGVLASDGGGVDGLYVE